MSSFNTQANPGAFVPLTDVFDTQLIRELDVNSDEFKEFLVRLRQSINDIAMVLNIKDSGYYVQQEFVNGQAYFPNDSYDSTTSKAPVLRQVFRKVIDFGALPNNTSKSVAHGLTITSGFRFTRLYGCASDPSTLFIPIPASAATDAEKVQLEVDTTNVIITTGSNMTGFTTTYVVLEYIKE